MRQGIVGLALLFGLLGDAPALAGVVPMEEALAEKSMGMADAPVTMVEHSSLTCPHCAAFHKETLPQIKKAYIDTGKVRLVFQDFPLGTLALAASMLARCSGDQRYFGMLEVLFRSQETWARSDNPLAALERVVRFGGLSKADVGECLNNEGLMNAIQQRAAAAQDTLGINSTPTFVVDGKVVAGALSFAEFQKILDEAIARKR